MCYDINDEWLKKQTNDSIEEKTKESRLNKLSPDIDL